MFWIDCYFGWLLTQTSWAEHWQLYFLIEHQFKMYWTSSIFAIVNNIFRPCFALDIDKDATCKIRAQLVSEFGWRWDQIILLVEKLTHWFCEVNGNERTQITFSIQVWIIVSGKALSWIVFNWTNVLNIGWIFTFARNPNGVALKFIRKN